MPPPLAPHAHTPFAFLLALAGTLLRPPRPQRSEHGFFFFFNATFSRMWLGASHKLWPWSLPLQKAGTEVSERATVASCSRPFCSITVALGLGPGRSSAPSQTLGPRRSLLRDAPAPHPASRAAAPPGTPRRALRAAPSPWKFPRRPGTALLPPASPPLPPGPSLPAAPGEEKNSLSSVRTAALCSLPRRPGLRRHAPGDWWKSRSPSFPHPQNCLLRPVQIPDAPLKRAPLAPALALWKQR